MSSNLTSSAISKKGPESRGLFRFCSQSLDGPSGLRRSPQTLVLPCQTQVRGDQTPIDVGMCFSNEPMICVPGEFGIRLEDHFYMNESGPRWFTEPSHSIDDPFGLAR